MTQLRKLTANVDWLLLVFLILVANQSVISFKILALLGIYVIRPNFRFGFRKGRLPLFYPLILVLSLLQLFYYAPVEKASYPVAVLVSMSFWFACLLTGHQVKLSLERRGFEVLLKTLQVFAVLNLLVSLLQLALIALAQHKLNPYTGLSFPYGMSTGDLIFGIFLENSYFNMMVSAMLTVFFLYYRRWFALIPFTSMLMVFGNIGTLAMLGVLSGVALVSLLISLTSRKMGRSGTWRWFCSIALSKRQLPALLVLLVYPVFFYKLVSPDNYRYIIEKLFPKKEVAVTQPVAPPVVAVASQAPGIDDYLLQLRGKRLSFRQTRELLQSRTDYLLLGAGAVRFSSLTAFRMAGMDSSRLFRKVLPQYSSTLYEQNHLLIHRKRLSLQNKHLSNGNWPDSFYNQLLGEYGLAGLFIFVFFYAGYYARRFGRLSYGLWLSALLLPFALLSYLFESLCVMIFFELLMEMDLHRPLNTAKSHAA